MINSTKILHTIKASTLVIAMAVSGGAQAAETTTQQKPFWPNDAQLVISISMQFEATAQDASDSGPFPPLDSKYADTIVPTWYQYGMNEGVPRLLNLWDKHNIKVTSHMVGRAVELNPELAKEVVARGHEASGHGQTWTPQYSMTEKEERESYIKSADIIEKVTGTRPVGFNAFWMRHSPKTLEILQDLGFIYHIKVVKLGVTDLSFHRATGAVVANILEKMGYTVIRSFDPHKENFARLRSGEIDMIASAWLPSSHGVYKQGVEEVAPTRELGLHYEPYALWGVPDYVPVSAVSTISDLLKPAVKAKMIPTIQGIGPGAGITRFSIKMMDEYKLKDAGYTFLTGTQAQCIDAFEQAVAEKRWVVVPLWHPQFLHNKYNIRELTDPKGLLGGKDRAVLLARQDRLDQLFSEQDIQQLDNIKLSNEIIAELDYAINRENKTEDEAAEIWLNSNQEKVGWIIDKVYSLPEPKEITIDKSLRSNQVEAMKLAAQNYAAFWDTGEVVYAKKALAEDFIDLNLPEGRKQGPQGPLDASNWFRTVVPDLRAEIEDMFIVDNKVILRLKFTGHFTGKMGEIEGKGQAILFSAVDMYSIEDGKIKTNWHLEDNDTLMKQLKQ